jgi:rod shape-determining protein MreC
MPLGTLDRDPPPFFRQGPSALSKLAVFSALAFFLMVADARFKVMQPLRVGLAVVLYPVQWLAMQPIQLVQGGGQYFSSLRSAQTAKDLALKKLGLQAQRANQVEQLALENQRLRKLLGLRDRLQSGGMAAQVLYDAADPYTRKVVIDRGMTDKVNLGSPVVDEQGVIGQVTRVYPLVSEVTLLTDRDHAIPVLNTRTGARGVAFGDTSTHADAMELRFMAANADVTVGDLLTTSGVDGVYPPGLPVARVEKVERRVDAVFARIYCVPLGLVAGASHVMVLEPVTAQIAARPVPEPVVATGKKGAAK